jgi:hypothetical protein
MTAAAVMLMGSMEAPTFAHDGWRWFVGTGLCFFDSARGPFMVGKETRSG